MAIHTPARRRARIWAGKAGVAWFCLLVPAGLFSATRIAPGLPTLIFTLSPVFMGLAYAVARLVALAQAGRPEAMSLANLQLGDSLERDALAWPLTTAALLGPLTLHAWGWLLFGDGFKEFAAFDEWILLSLVLTAVAHTMLVAWLLHFARQLSGIRFGAPPADGQHTLQALAALTIGALVPGVILLGIPVLVILGTGLVLIPPLLHWTLATYRGEREALLSAARSECAKQPGVLVQHLQDVLLSGHASDDMQMHALGLLDRIASPDAFRSVLLQFLERAQSLPEPEKYPHALSAAFSLCNTHVLSPPLETSLRLAQHPDTEVGTQAIRFLARSPHPKSQAVLQATLHSRDVSVQLAAVRAMGQIGTQPMINELGTLAALGRNSTVQRAARTAIQNIRSRLGGAGPAALSFPIDEIPGGALALAQDAPGSA